MNAWWAQSRAEVRMTIRRGETLLLTVGIPVLLLVFFSLTKVASTPTKSRVDFIAPGILALCVLSTSLVALSIATGFERSYGVLRRLYVTPIGTRRLIGAKIAGVLVTEALQIVILTLVAFTLTWRPRGGAMGGFEVAALLVLGSAGCAGIGLALAGRRRTADVVAGIHRPRRGRAATRRHGRRSSPNPRPGSHTHGRGLAGTGNLGSRRAACRRANF